MWMTPQERISTKFIHYDDLSFKDNIKAELVGNIKISGVDMYVVKGEKVIEMQDISRENVICNKYNKEGKGERMDG